MKGAALLLASVVGAGGPTPPALDSAAIAGLRARAIGPAVCGGRIEAIDVAATDPNLVYVGAAGGGVWKSTDAGGTFKPVFDDHTQSIGAVAIDPRRPETVWVGTGETDARNSVSVGSGIYRTENGGEDWERMGLPDSERIARIVVDPADSRTVYVAVAGRLWSDSAERGVYRTTDGGKNWTRVLFVNASTGGADLAVDPKNPKILYAALWDFRRWPYFFRSGGRGSGLYQSLDGGDHWKRLETGLPKGELGRIAVAVAPSRPATVYATIESKKSGLYRSDDAGRTWRLVNASPALGVRPFYFSHLAVDPADPERLYKPGFQLAVSGDGGKTFSTAGTGPSSYHPDVHAIWIDPADSRHLLMGTDGGVYASRDRGARWIFVRTLAVSQPYRVALDDAHPYNVYGGFQDNAFWYGPSRSAGALSGAEWKSYGMNDGFYTFPDPRDPDVVYWESQGGDLHRFFRSTGENQQIRPLPAPGDAPLRFNWEAPVAVSAADPRLLLTGAQVVFASRDRGETWKRISGDLTTDDKEFQRQAESGGVTPEDSAAENYCTISAIAPSPLDPGIIWAGTDDGNVQVTRDGGRRWESVAAGIPALPRGTGVSGIAASREDPATAYVTLDGHARGDFVPYVFRTGDFGRTWTALATSGVSGYAHVIREDPEAPFLLYLGTEDGLFLSIDRGKSWARFTGGLPRVPVRDIAVQARESDLVVATHGRGFYVVDDISVLRRLTPDVVASDLAVLDGRPISVRVGEFMPEWTGDGEFFGENPPDDAVITFYRRERRLLGDSRIEIADAQGRVIATLPGGARRGINRVSWSSRLKPPRMAAAEGMAPGGFSGPTAPVGTYTVRVIDDERQASGTIRLVPDPALTHSDRDRAARQETLTRLFRMQEDLAFLGDSVASVREAVSRNAAGLGASDLGSRLALLGSRLDAFRATLVATRPGILGIAGASDRQLRESIAELFGSINGFGGEPSGGQRDRVAALEGELDRARALFDEIAREVGAVNRELAGRGRNPIEIPTREQWRRRGSGT